MQNPENWGAPELRSLGVGGVGDPKIHTPPHTCYHVKFGSSASKVYAQIEGTPKLESAGTPPPYGRGVADPIEIRLSSRVLSSRIWSF